MVFFNQLKDLKMKIYSNLSNISIHFYIKLRIPIMHRHIFKKLSQNPDYVQAHCNDQKIFFILHFINSIYTIIQIFAKNSTFRLLQKRNSIIVRILE